MSKWRPVTSGIAQGLVLRPASFNIFVGDVDSGVEAPSENWLTTPNCVVQSHTGEEGWIQGDLDSLEMWVCVKLMKFSKAKCKVH